MNRFEGKVAFVTGGASGLGAAAAHRLSEEGARLAIADIDLDGAQQVAGELPGSVAYEVDTANAGSVERAIAATVSEFGRIDAIFNNAGIDGRQQALHETDDDNWRHVRSVNGDGVFHVLRHGIAALLQTGGGAIVNTSSTAGLTGQANISAYTFTKAGIVGLTRSAALEYADRNVRVNAIAPTVVWTPLVQHFVRSAPDPEQMYQMLQNYNPMPGMPAPADVAAAVAFLLSDDARWITGHTLPIDGGYVAR